MFPRFSLRAAFLFWTVAACLCFAVFGVRQCLRPIVQESTLSQLKVGMTTGEVEQLLGRPAELIRRCG
jgi:outer membrane protein assembly factor BamE (lipoprotein component of BamABCDE complex)